MLEILANRTRQLISPFITSQLLQNTDESSFKHFIEHLADVRENSRFKH